MARPSTSPLDRNLEDLPETMRWREWMGRAEAVIFASPVPVGRDQLARVVGDACDLDRLIAAIQAELRHRPYELAAVAGGWQHRTRPGFADAIHASGALKPPGPALSQGELTILMAIGYFQPITRARLAEILGRKISRDTIAALRAEDLVVAGPRSPEPGAPYTYVTTKAFPAAFGFDSLQDLPDRDKLEDAGLLSPSKGRDSDPFASFGENFGDTSDHEAQDDAGTEDELQNDGA